jgi:hypothetical protein
MKLQLNFFALSAVCAILCACSQTKTLNSSKLQDYDKTISNVVAIQTGGYPITDTFKADLSEEFKKCGGELRFATVVPNVPLPVASADSILTIKEIQHTTETLTQNGLPVGAPVVAKVRYEFSLVDVVSHRTVWKAQDDFAGFNANSIVKALRSRDPELDWVEALTSQMQQNGLLTGCRQK